MRHIELKITVDLDHLDDATALVNAVAALAHVSVSSQIADSTEVAPVVDEEVKEAPKPKKRAPRKTKAAEPAETAEDNSQPDAPGKLKASLAAKAEKEADPEPKKEESKTSATVEQVRALVAEKAGTHRTELKAKLKALGATSVTTLQPENYDQFLSYLSNL